MAALRVHAAQTARTRAACGASFREHLPRLQAVPGVYLQQVGAHVSAPRLVLIGSTNGEVSRMEDNLDAFEATWVTSEGLPYEVRKRVRAVLADAWPQDDPEKPT